MKRIVRTSLVLLAAVLGVSFMSAGSAVAVAAAPQGQNTPSTPPAASTRHNPAAWEQRMRLPFYAPRYVAVGDSVAAGLGLAPLSGASDEDKACGRSADAYANKVSEHINARLKAASWGTVQMKTSLLACQGATTDHLTQPQNLANRSIAPQLDQAFAKGTPALMTITVGANDAHWAEFLNECASVHNCATPENTARAQAYVQTAKAKLEASLADIRSRSRFLPPTVVITGYYDTISTSCITSIFTPDEVAWVKAQTDNLNTALQQAAATGGWLTRFAPVDFTGHDVCSPDSWLQKPFSGDPAPMHPTARGQQAIAEAVVSSLGL